VAKGFIYLLANLVKLSKGRILDKKGPGDSNPRPPIASLTFIYIPIRIICMSERDDLLQKYASNLPDNSYRNHYVSYARNFLDSATALDKEGIAKYLAKLKRQKKSAGTIRRRAH